MTTKIYKVTSFTDAFASDGFFRCRIGFGRTSGDVKQILGQKKCPILRIPHPGGVVSTSNKVAQLFIENFITPARSKRSGEARPSGPAFTDVTDEAPGVDVDLDPIFDGA